MNAGSSKERNQILTFFRQTLEGSSIPLVLGARPFDLARASRTNRGFLRLDFGHAHLTMGLEGDTRRIFGESTTRLVRVTGRFTRDMIGGWSEADSLVVEYATLTSLRRGGVPERSLSSQRRPDGSSVASTIERVPRRDQREELLRRSTCLVQPDSSRVEEDETLHRIAANARYEVLRREYDAQRCRQRSLEYRYPWQPLRAYAAMRDAWLAATRCREASLLAAAVG